MKKKAKQLIKHPLIYGSVIVVFGNLLANFFNFLFNLFMSRTLSVSDYGILASVMSLITLPALAVNAISPAIVRFAGGYFASENFPLLRGFYIKMSRILLVIAISFFILLILLLPTISEFFKIQDKNILIMTNVIIFISILGIINTAFLQAKLAFTFQVLLGVSSALIKLVVGSILVLLGSFVSGATIAMIFAGLITYALSFIPLRFIFDKKIITPTIKTKEFFTYGIPSSLTILGLTSFISADIILVKHFFDPHIAGLYAGLSLIGRVIFFVSSPIGTVMFPLIVQKHSRNENFTGTFKLSLLLVFVSSVTLAIFYALFPKFSILFFLKKEEYLAISTLLVPFAVFTSLYSLLVIIANFYLSIKKTKIFIPIILGSILQIILITIFHQTFLQIILISIVIIFLLDVLLLLYYRHATRTKS